MIQVNGLTKKFGDFTALSALDCTIPAGCTHAEILLHASTETAQAALRFDSGEFTALTPTQTVSDKLPGGTRCTLLRFRVDIPENAQTAQLKLTLPSQSCKIYDTALVLL